MGISNIGGLIGAFAGPKLDKIWKSDELKGQIDKTIAGLDDYRTRANDYLSRYDAANNEAIAQGKVLTKDGLDRTKTLLDQYGNRPDFLARRNSAETGDIANLNTLLGQLGGGMSRADKIASSRLGYAGLPNSTYNTKARQSYLGSFAAPIANTIFGGATNAAVADHNAFGEDVNNQLGIIDWRSRMPFDFADKSLRPLFALQQSRGNEISQEGGLSDVTNSNFGGFRERKNKWAAAGDAMDEGVNSAIDAVASYYSGGAVKNAGHGSGGGGGGQGGSGGGGFGQFGGWGSGGAAPSAQSSVQYSPPPPQYQQQYQPAYQSGGYPPGYNQAPQSYGAYDGVPAGISENQNYMSGWGI